MMLWTVTIYVCLAGVPCDFSEGSYRMKIEIPQQQMASCTMAPQAYVADLAFLQGERVKIRCEAPGRS